MQNPHVPILSESEPIQNQQVSVIGCQVSNTNPVTNQIWSVPTQQISQQPTQYQQGNAQCTNIPTQQVEPIVSKQNQTKTFHVQLQSSHNPMIRYRQSVAQSTHLVSQSPYLTNLSIQDSATWTEQSSVSRTDPSVVELLNQQQAVQRQHYCHF